MRKGFLALVGLLAACSQAPSEAGRQPAQKQGPAALAQTAPADAPTAAAPIMESALIGSWSRDRSCASDWGFSLSRNGEVFDDDGAGLWAVDAAGRVVTIVRVQEMGMDPAPNAPRKVRALTVREISNDRLVGTYDDGEAIDARRCPDPAAKEADQEARPGSASVGRVP